MSIYIFKRQLSVLIFILLVACVGTAQSPIDKKATKRTRLLYYNLHQLMNSGKVLFGHQDDLAYGVGWRNIDKESDVRKTVNDYPSVFGWDLGHIEMDSVNQIDGIPFFKLKEYIKEVYKMGGVNTISWHLHNPSTGGSSWDTSGQAIKSILPNGKNHQKYLTWLDKVADFALSLKTGFWGKRIPIIFRPYHENTGSWFWWGEALTTPEDYKALWRMTVEHFQKRGVHNILYAYSPDNFKSEEHYLKGYPGDDYVDILGHDLYSRNVLEATERTKFIKTLSTNIQILSELAAQKNKVIAITETGCDRVPYAAWWTETLWQALEPHKLSYVLLWRNGRPDHYFVPYPEQESAADFKRFYTHERLLFSKKISPMKIYRTKLLLSKEDKNTTAIIQPTSINARAVTN